MDINISVKNNTIYLDYGYIHIGDFTELRVELSPVVKSLSKPFQTINIFRRSVTKHWLPLEEELEAINLLSNYLCDRGRDHTVWVVPRNSLLFKSFQSIIRPEVFREFADTLEEAEEKIEKWNSRLEYLSIPSH